MVPLDERFTQALHGGARAWRGALERHLKARGLTVAGWSAVAAVAACDQAPPQRELARLLGVDGATLVSTIDRLAAAGLVERQPDPHDRRVKLVALTAKGRALAAEVQDEAAALRRLTLQRFDAQQLDVAATLLEQLQLFLETA
jgi:MarR family transcriptional regulator for hemolysin